MELSTVGPALHDRATRGEALTSREQAILEGWYAAQDKQEAADLGFAQSLIIAPSSISVTQQQIRVLLAQIGAATAQVERLAGENQSLQQENRKLQQQLAQHFTVEAT